MESTGRMLREMLDGGSLERSEQALIKKVAESPGDTGLLHRFAEVLRQRGKLREAGTVYARIGSSRPMTLEPALWGHCCVVVACPTLHPSRPSS